MNLPLLGANGRAAAHPEKLAINPLADIQTHVDGDKGMLTMPLSP